MYPEGATLVYHATVAAIGLSVRLYVCFIAIFVPEWCVSRSLHEFNTNMLIFLHDFRSVVSGGSPVLEEGLSWSHS